jgi:hypothetical protein
MHTFGREQEDLQNHPAVKNAWNILRSRGGREGKKLTEIFDAKAEGVADIDVIDADYGIVLKLKEGVDVEPFRKLAADHGLTFNPARLGRVLPNAVMDRYRPR